jgi:hypothetical protein
MTRAEAISDWLQECESNPDLWRQGGITIRPEEVGLTPAEIRALFDHPTLAEVRQAVEQYLQQLAGHGPAAAPGLPVGEPMG